ncbi:MAG TPA: hypothetical protein P5125_02265 [Kiritimatiellia bacterium]|nr:hypothetical protein [Kiritimatiellia bacterium]HRU19158.1 hypothetical protein [Kiritimatiellia bacterium]
MKTCIAVMLGLAVTVTFADGTKAYARPGSDGGPLYTARGDAPRIAKMITEAQAAGRREVVIPYRNDAANDDKWIIEETVLIPSGMKVILDGARLVQADGVCCNLFANEHAWTDDRCTAKAEDRDIAIEGRNGATLDGGNWNGLGERSKPPELAGKRLVHNCFVYFHNVKGFKVSGLKCRHQRYWATCFSFCEQGVIRDLRFEADISWVSEDGRDHRPNRLPGKYVNLWVKNGDGVNLRKGCHDIVVENITGWTEDDVVALTNLCGEEMKDIVEGKSTDIHHITVRNIRAGTWLWFNQVRLLCCDGAKVHDVVIDGVHDEYDPSWMNWQRNASAVQINDSAEEYYRKRNCAMGEMRDIVIRNVTSGAGFPIRLFCPMQNVTIENLHLLPGAKGALAVQCDAEFDNVTVSGITADETVRLFSFLNFHQAEGAITVRNARVPEAEHLIRNSGTCQVTLENVEIGKLNGEREIKSCGGHWIGDKVPLYQDLKPGTRP